MNDEKCPCCLRPWRCRPDKPHSTYIEARVQCPDCRRTFRLAVPKREYRAALRRTFSVPQVMCLACNEVRQGKQANQEKAAV